MSTDMTSFAPGDRVLVDGSAYGRIRNTPAGEPEAPGAHRWVRMDTDGHSFILAVHRLSTIPPNPQKGVR
jgi:hypothetical protein